MKKRRPFIVLWHLIRTAVHNLPAHIYHNDDSCTPYLNQIPATWSTRFSRGGWRGEREREEWEWEWERLGIRGRHVPEPEYWLIQVILKNYKGVFKVERWIFIHIVTFLDNVPLFLHCQPWPLVSRVAVHSQRLNNCQLEVIITVASALTCTCAGSRSS